MGPSGAGPTVIAPAGSRSARSRVWPAATAPVSAAVPVARVPTQTYTSPVAPAGSATTAARPTE